MCYKSANTVRYTAYGVHVSRVTGKPTSTKVLHIDLNPWS